MKLVTRLLTRYWGYLAVVIAVAGFFLHSIGLAIVGRFARSDVPDDRTA